jgi:hypothetical protein
MWIGLKGMRKKREERSHLRWNSLFNYNLLKVGGTFPPTNEVLSSFSYFETLGLVWHIGSRGRQGGLST